MRRLPNGPRRMLLSIAQVIIAVYFGILVLFFVFQGKLVFVSTSDLYRTPAANGWSYEEVFLPVANETTHGWFINAEQSPKGAIIFSHGNAGNIADRLESISILRDLGYDVLAYDYGGYGQSTGRSTESRCYKDIRAMWQWLVEEKEVPEEKIILFGRSLGAGPTCQLATEVTPGAVIIESAFLSVPKMGEELYPWLPVKYLSRIRFNNAKKIANVKEPLLIVHSPDDQLISFRHGKALFDLARDPKTFLEIEGDHNEGFWKSGALYTDGLTKFLEEAATR